MIGSEFYKKIIEVYLDTESVQGTADLLGTSVVKVRKVLLTEGLWSSKKSLEIQHYINLGKTTAEIAVLLCSNEKAIQQYLPYSRGLYNSENPTVAAINSSDYRERIRIAQERTLRKNMDLDKKNRWNEMYTEERRNTMDPVRLHLELVWKWCNEKEHEEGINVLRKYGNVAYGDTITRDIVVPSDLPLWALNYAIQKCFGWQNSHLHCFELPEEQFVKLISNSFTNYCELVGVVFRAPWMEEEAQFWQDDYESGSFKTWLKSKYKGPYKEVCYEEGIHQSKNDLERMENRFQYIEVERCFSKDGHEHFEYLRPITEAEYRKRKAQGPVETHEDNKYGMRDRVIKEVYEFHNIPLDATRWMSETESNQLLERLSVSEVLSIHSNGINGDLSNHTPESFDDFMNKELSDEIQKCIKVNKPDRQPHINPVSESLFFNYDFGDDWTVKITASTGADDLIVRGITSQEELDEAISIAKGKHLPVCIAQDGYPVFDDAGGMYGYFEFLKGINNQEEENSFYGYSKESLGWAKSLGWSKRKTSNKNLL